MGQISKSFMIDAGAKPEPDEGIIDTGACSGANLLDFKLGSGLHQGTRPATPELTWTTVPPAKSRMPSLAKYPVASHITWATTA